MSRRPTIEDVIDVLAAREGRDPDSQFAAEIEIFPGHREMRMITYRHLHRVRQEAESILRIWDLIEAINEAMKEPE